MIKIVAWGLIGIVGLIALVLATAFVFERYNRTQDAKRYPPPGRMVDIGGGRRLHIRCEGQGSPTIVLETGGGVPSLMQYPLLDRLATFTRACAYDRAGMGWSDDGPYGRTFSAYAADLHALLTTSGERGPFILVGESWGGILVHAYARAYQQDVAGLVLVDAAEEQIVRQVLLPSIKPLLAQMRRPALFAEFGLVRYGAPRQPAMSPGLTEAQRRQLGAVMSRPEQWGAPFDLTPYERMPAGGYGPLGALPLVVIRHGRPFTGPQAVCEPGWPAAQARLAALSSDSTTIVAKDNGHMIAEENPALVAEAVRAFVMRLRAR
jgi:pimeloyl-ACP methyl ester carboxylesterase